MVRFLFTTSSSEVKSEEERPKLRWLGVFWIILGMVAIATAFVATVATMVIFGVLLLMAGVAQLAQAWSFPGPDRSWEFLTGLIYLLVGLVLVIDPVNGAIGLTFLIGMLLLVRGAVQLAMAATGRRFGRSSIWHFIGGFLSLILAILLLGGLPEVGTWFIGVLVGIELLMGGTVLLLTPSVIMNADKT